MRISDKPKVKFHYQEVSFSLRQRRRLQEFILLIFKKERRAVSTVNYIFCTDSYLLGINRLYLGHDTYTDIITFDLSEPGQALVADIYISIDRVRENAALFKNSFRFELLRVIFHGALHLCGYNDKKQAEVFQMRRREDHYISLFVPRGTSTKD